MVCGVRYVGAVATDLDLRDEEIVELRPLARQRRRNAAERLAGLDRATLGLALRVGL